MRKTIIAGVAAIGFLAIGLTVMGHAASYREADAEGSGADIGMTRHTVVGMIGTDRATRPLLVAMSELPAPY